ncbi:MAG: alpha/beta hydrolase [Sphingomonadales bacterium]|nr:alpha/beta hydrolase [Sphingomonadales bacterium]
MTPFRVAVPQAELDDVAARLAAARGFEDVFGGDPALGATAGFVAGLAAYWRERFDWRALEARINRVPQGVMQIDGLGLHVLHRRSSRADAVPLLLIHGWPSSFLEFLGVIDDLAEPPEGEPAFHVIVPSLPGHGFSAMRRGTSPRRMAAILGELMARLGYERYLVQGGNWGSLIGTLMAGTMPERVIGLHLNSINGTMPAGTTLDDLTPEDRAIGEAYLKLQGFPHFAVLSRTPASLTYALNDSPVGLLAWVGERLHDWADLAFPGNPGLAADWIVGTVALYWFTRSIGASSLLYREMIDDPVAVPFVAVPTAVALFRAEMVKVPRPWAEAGYAIARWTTYPRGGHFAAIEVPGLFVADLRGFARGLA